MRRAPILFMKLMMKILMGAIPNLLKYKHQ